MTLRRPSRLALRIYLLGLVQFVVVALAMDVDHRIRMRQFRAEQAAAGIPTTGSPWADMPPPPPQDAEPGQPPPRPPMAHRPRPPHGPPWMGWPIGIVLIVVGVTSWLTARSIGKPLGQLSDVTRAFGEGRLEARAKLGRKDEIGEVASAFDNMADRIMALLLAERELLANVSHELRTPLARIRVALDIASEGDAELARETLRDITQDLAELERIVDDVLASARLALDTSGPSSQPALPMRAERVDARVMLEKSASRFRGLHPERALEVDLGKSLPFIDADQVLMRRVVDNLLDNAHKYTEVLAEPIRLEGRSVDGDLVISVKDRGIGIGKDDLGRLFEPFFRADRSRTRATGGLGLGLALARRVVVAHKGTINFESEIGSGTIARVRIPAMKE